MMHFPVTNSNLSATHLAIFLQEKYKLGSGASCQIIKTGINHTYLITDAGQKFVFRVYCFNWRTRTEITEEIKVLNQLKDNGISVSYAIADKDETYIQTLNAPEGERFGVMFSFAEGKKLLNYPVDTHFRIGALMARLHLITHNQSINRVTYTPDVLLVGSLNHLSNFLPADTEEMQFMQAAQTYLLNEFGKVKTGEIRHGIVHLDIWFDNLNINEKEVTIFDFDFCGNGWLCLDIAYYILQVHSTERDEQECQSKVEGFLQGYESITVISAEEKRIIPMLGVSLYFFYLGIQSQRYDNWSNSFLNEMYLKRYINLLVKKYYDQHELG